jgi:hypothetical protein
MDVDDLTDRAKDVIRFFLPVLTVISIASLLALVMTLSELDIQASVFVPEENAGTAGEAEAGLGNALLFIIPAIVGSFAILFVIRRGRRRLLKSVFRFLLAFTAAMIIIMFIYMLVNLLSSISWWALSSGLPYPGTIISIWVDTGSFLIFMVMAVLAGYVATSIIFNSGFSRKERNGALITISAFMGAFMAVILPTWTVLILLVALAIWDIYAVFRGPIKEMVELESKGQFMVGRVDLDPLGDRSDEFPFNNMTYDSGLWALGIGDLVFYSVLGAHSLFYSIPYVRTEGPWMLPFFFVPVVTAILIGFAFTIYRLTRSGGESILPGLPIPMFLGVAVFAVMMALARWVI